MSELPPGWHPGRAGIGYVREPRTAATVEGCWAIEREGKTMTLDRTKPPPGYHDYPTLGIVSDGDTGYEPTVFHLVEAWANYDNLCAPARREERIATLRWLADDIAAKRGLYEDCVDAGTPNDIQCALRALADALEKEPPP